MTTTRTAPTWTLSGQLARHGEAEIDLTTPQGGLRLAATGDSLLGLELGIEGRTRIEPGDQWTREGDLVAVYEPDDGRTLRATGMWRPVAGPPSSWELVVSAQTALLESDPRLAVVSDLAVGEVVWGRAADGQVTWTPLAAGAPLPPEADCLLVRRGGDAVLVAVHPADRRRIELTRADGRLRVTCRLFSETIEKGVLLRSRVRAASGPGDSSGWADEIVTAFATEPPPLTT